MYEVFPLTNKSIGSSFTPKFYIVLAVIGFSTSFISGLYGVTNQIRTDELIGILLLIGFISGIGFGFLGMSRGIFPELNQPEVGY